MYNNYNNSPNLMISRGSVVSSQQKTFLNKAQAHSYQSHPYFIWSYTGQPVTRKDWSVYSKLSRSNIEGTNGLFQDIQ
jgi:hypothetical protein